MKDNDVLAFKSLDHPAQSEFTIGYIKLEVPPSDIHVTKSTNSMFLGALRSPADTPFKTGYSNWDITVRMQFYGEEEIASKLLPIVGMCKVAPIVNVNNLTIKEQLFGHLAGTLGASTAVDDLDFLGTLNYYYSKDNTISVIIEGMSINVMSQYGGLCLDVNLYLKYYNHHAVSPYFRINEEKLKGRVDRWIQQAKLNYDTHVNAIKNFKVNLNSDNEFMVVGRYFHAISTGGVSFGTLIELLKSMAVPEKDRADAINDILEKDKYKRDLYNKKMEELEKTLQEAQAKERASQQTKPDPQKEGASSKIKLGWPLKQHTIVHDWGESGHTITRSNPTGVHEGVDLRAAQRTPVFAAESGKVVTASEDTQYSGGLVVISHEGGITTHYAHLSQVWVRVGMKVEKGQQIGESGGTPGTKGAGSSSGPHLHFAVKEKGKPVDPKLYLDLNDNYKNIRPIAAGAQTPEINIGKTPYQEIRDSEQLRAAAEDIKNKLEDGWTVDIMKTDENYIVFFKEFGIPFFKDFNISSYMDYDIQGFKLVDTRARIILNSIGISLKNKFVPIPIAGYPMPFYQHLGGCNVSVGVGGLALVDEKTGTCTPLSNLQALYNLKEVQFLALRGKIDYTPGSNYDIQGVRILNKPLGLLGLVNFVISDLAVGTVPDTPNAMNVNLNMFENYVYDNTIYNDSGNISIFQDYILPDLIVDELKKLGPIEAKNLGPETFKLYLQIQVWDKFERDNPNYMKNINNDAKLVEATKKTIEGWANVEKLNSLLPAGGLEDYQKLMGGSFLHGSIVQTLVWMTSMGVPGTGTVAAGPIPSLPLLFAKPVTEIIDVYFMPSIKQASWMEHAQTRREYIQDFYTKNCDKDPFLIWIRDKINRGEYTHELKNRFNFDMDALTRTCYPDLLLQRGEDPGAYIDSGLEPDPEQMSQLCAESVVVSNAAIQNIKEHYSGLLRYKTVELSYAEGAEDKGQGVLNKPETEPLKHSSSDGPYETNASSYINLMTAVDTNGGTHLVVDQFTYDTSFPTFKIYLIEDVAADDSSEFLGLKQVEWDKFYSYSAVTEIEVARFKHDVDVAVIKFLNTFGNLTTKIYGADVYLTQEFSRDVIEKDFENRYRLQRMDNGTLVQMDRFTNELMPITKMFLQAGTKILIKLGYHNLEHKLPTVFTGLVTEVQPGEIVTVVCQGFLSELLAPLDGRFPSSFGGTKEKIRQLFCLDATSSGLMEDASTYLAHNAELMTYYGQKIYEDPTYAARLFNVVNNYNSLTSLYDRFMGKSQPTASGKMGGQGIDPRLRKIHRAVHLNNACTAVIVQKLLEHPAAIHFGGWYLTNSGMDGSATMFGGFFDVWIGQSNRSIENIDPVLLSAWQKDNNLLATYPTFPTFYVNDKNMSTVWETIRELGYRHPTHITTVRPYGTNASLIMKERTDTYKTSGLSFYGNNRTEIVQTNIFAKFLNEEYNIKTFTDDMFKIYHGATFDNFNNYVAITAETKKAIQDYILYYGKPTKQQIYYVSADKVMAKNEIYFEESLPAGTVFVKPSDIWTVALQMGKLEFFKLFLPADMYLVLADKFTNFKAKQAKIDPVLGPQLSVEREVEPVTMPHYVSDKVNMVFNNIRTNENIFNAVLIKKDVEDIALESMIALDDNILDSHKKVFNYTSKNIQANAEDMDARKFNDLQALYGFSILMEKLAQMYKGELAMVGNPNIRPFDTIVLDDAQSQLYGSFEVASVIHRFTQDEGFVTFVEPHLISNVSNYALAAAQGRIEDMVREGNKQSRFLRSREERNIYSSSETAREFMKTNPNASGDFITSTGSNASQLLLKYFAAGTTGGLSGLIASTEMGRSFFDDEGAKGAEIGAYIGMYQAADAYVLGDWISAASKARSLPMFMFSRFFPSWASTLSNYMYHAGPYRQPIVIKPLTLRSVPFIAGIKGAVFNSWFDSATMGLSRAIKALPEEFVALNKGLRSMIRAYNNTIGSKFKFLRFN